MVKDLVLFALEFLRAESFLFYHHGLYMWAAEMVEDGQYCLAIADGGENLHHLGASEDLHTFGCHGRGIENG